MPSVNVLADIIINQPAQAVSTYVADPSNAPAWYVNIESAQWKTPPPLRAGALSVGLPRPEPDFRPPWSILFTVAQARRPASSAGRPRRS